MDAQVKAVQADLIALGYLPKGADDGSLGGHTKRALKHFQRQASQTYRISSMTNKPDDIGAAETFKGKISGLADADTAKEIKKWIDRKWKLPLGRFQFTKISNGILREDVAAEWTKLATLIKGKGGTIDGPYGDTRRGLHKAKKSGASSFSFHIVGRAVDLQQELNNPPAKRYQVAKDKENGKIGYWRIYCKTDLQDGSQGDTYDKGTVKCWDFYDKKEYSLPADAYYLDLTDEIESGGMFERIHAQGGWETSYNKTEWWHFQYTLNIQETFQDECELVGYSEKDLKNAGYTEVDMDHRPG